MSQLERELYAARPPIPGVHETAIGSGVGLLTATAMVAAAGGA